MMSIYDLFIGFLTVVGHDLASVSMLNCARLYMMIRIMAEIYVSIFPFLFVVVIILISILFFVVLIFETFVFFLFFFTFISSFCIYIGSLTWDAELLLNLDYG